MQSALLGRAVLKNAFSAFSAVKEVTLECQCIRGHEVGCRTCAAGISLALRARGSAVT